jgi:hypothetical protein
MSKQDPSPGNMITEFKIVVIKNLSCHSHLGLLLYFRIFIQINAIHCHFKQLILFVPYVHEVL